MKQTARLENWQNLGANLMGDVYDHPDVIDGRPFLTGMIVRLNESTGICETVAGLYYLGKRK